METIKILKRNGMPVLIDAEIIGDFAIHFAVENYSRIAGILPLYAVTYLPGNSIIFRAPTEKMCREFVNKISELDWWIIKKALQDTNQSFNLFKLSRDQCKGFDFELFDNIRDEIYSSIIETAEIVIIPIVGFN